jgi:uncharacterized protein
MKNAIILHGLADKKEYYDPKLSASSNQHWLPWLQRQLILKDFKADTPEVLYPFKFDWDSWVREVERFDIKPNTILVGHSMGGGFWVRYLSEHPEIAVDKVVLVAPWLNLRHEENTNFFDFEIDPGIVEHANQFIIFGSDNDHPDVQNSVNLLKEKLPNITFRSFHNYGHFCYNDMKTEAFPELLEVLV